MSYFSKMRASTTLSMAAIGPDGLREAQVGALMAVAGHATTSDSPAQVVLPTGVGKTAIAMLAPYVLGARRALVVVPGKLVRGQVEAAFLDPARARKAGVLPQDHELPKVAVAEHLASKEDWQAWKDADVVIGTPHVLSPVRSDVARMPAADFFDLVIYDEAHHLPASTWSAILTSTTAYSVLLTATPFRNDGQRLPGELVYSYPLGRAIARGVFGEVRYRPIDEVPGEDMDVTLAKAAVSRLNSQEHREAGSRVLIRSNSVDHARRLVDIYDQAGARLGLIVHTTAYSRARSMRAQVEGGDLAGFACVGALTEGFDFPALKIGAYHVAHKTLGPTVQFIGRLSRKGDVAGELLAPRTAITKETAALYREDQAWSDLLPDLLDSAMDRERDIRRFIRDARVEGDLAIAPLSVMPSRSVHIYITDAAPTLDAVLPRIAGAEVVQRFVHSPTNTLAFVTRRVHRPRFMRLDTLDVPIYELHLVTYVEGQKALFVSTSTEPARRDILAVVAPAPRRSLTGAQLRRLLDAAQLDRFFSIGKRAAGAHGARTSYETRAGSKTEDDITPADARGWDLGHAMGRSGSGSGTFGFSVARSKIWEPGAADSLFGFRAWCEHQANELGRTTASHIPSKLDLLGMSEPLAEFPTDPVLAILPPNAFTSLRSLAIEGDEVVAELIELHGDSANSSPDEVALRVEREGAPVAVLHCRRDGSVSSEGSEIMAVDADTGDSEPLAEFLTHEPPTIFFASGARATGDRFAQPPPAMPRVAAELRRPRSWDGVAITVEFDVPPANKVNVGTATAELLKAEMPLVIQDHLPGELADFIAIDATRLIPEIRLVHCKSSGGPTPAARLGDVQELVAQSIRSVQWLGPGSHLWAELRRRLDERDATKIIQGDANDAVDLLDRWVVTPPVATWSIWMVQPGISAQAVDGSDTVTSLLNASHSWVAGQSVELGLVCSR